MVQHLAHPDTIIVASRHGVRVEIPVQFNNFIDGDTHCLIEQTDPIKDADVLVKHYLYPNQNEQLIRLLLLVGTLQNLGARSVEVFTPYLPYARQDKAHFPGEAVAAKLVCQTLHVAGIRKLHTIDCHFMKGAAASVVEGLHIKNTLVQDYLIARLERAIGSRKYHVVGPDAGASYLTHGETMKKARAHSYGQNADGSISRDVAQLDDTHLHLTHNTIVVADDMVSTGSTMIKALQNLQSRKVGHLYAMTTHGLFLKDSFDKITANVEGLYYTDTIPLEGAVTVVDEVFAGLLT